jgi:hypothetical protein
MLMATNEFRWGIKPTVPGQWHNTCTHDGFEIEISAEWIEARKEDDGQQNVQRDRAEQIVDVKGLPFEYRSLSIFILGTTGKRRPFRLTSAFRPTGTPKGF